VPKKVFIQWKLEGKSSEW